MKLDINQQTQYPVNNDFNSEGLAKHNPYRVLIKKNNSASFLFTKVYQVTKHYDEELLFFKGLGINPSKSIGAKIFILDESTSFEIVLSPSSLNPLRNVLDHGKQADQTGESSTSHDLTQFDQYVNKDNIVLRSKIEFPAPVIIRSYSKTKYAKVGTSMNQAKEEEEVLKPKPLASKIAHSNPIAIPFCRDKLFASNPFKIHSDDVKREQFEIKEFETFMSAKECTNDSNKELLLNSDEEPEQFKTFQDAAVTCDFHTPPLLNNETIQQSAQSLEPNSPVLGHTKPLVITAESIDASNDTYYTEYKASGIFTDVLC